MTSFVKRPKAVTCSKCGSAIETGAVTGWERSVFLRGRIPSVKIKSSCGQRSMRKKFKEIEMEVIKTGTWTEKKGLAQMLKGGVIMDVVTAEHAKIAEDGKR